MAEIPSDLERIRKHFDAIRVGYSEQSGREGKWFVLIVPCRITPEPAEGFFIERPEEYTWTLEDRVRTRLVFSRDGRLRFKDSKFNDVRGGREAEE